MTGNSTNKQIHWDHC